MDCSYFAAGSCRSCQLIELGYPDQVARVQERVRAALASDTVWEPPVLSAESGFRNKAKMVVGGTAAAPTLGILDRDGTGVDLRECGLHETALHDALPAIADLISAARLTPYSVAERRGELKHVIATVAPSGELMVRFVLRSTEAVSRLGKHLAVLTDQAPAVVVSVNLQPEHKAILEGPDELLLTERETLTMEVNGRPLHLRPQSFFQTNTEVAARLYREAATIVEAASPASVWDLYCGVGGFGLHVAAEGRAVTGVEFSASAIDSARLSSAELGIEGTWLAGDATAFALASATAPDLVIVNPPRRGIGATLAGWLEERSEVREVVYSSCNVDSLAADLARMGSFSIRSARLLDMFPHTDHHEVLVSLTR